jgi:hypothetical protein
VSKLVLLIDRPCEQLRGLAHSSGVNTVLRSIAGDELVKTKARDCRVESESLCEGIKGEEKEGCVGVRARHKMVQGTPHGTGKFNSGHDEDDSLTMLLMQ